jgi:hypothetical protein
MVLRKQPPGKLLASAHAVDREHRVLSALAGSSVPVPRPLLMCSDASVIGTPFYCMDFAQASLLQLPGSQGAPQQLLLPQRRPAVYCQLGHTSSLTHSWSLLLWRPPATAASRARFSPTPTCQASAPGTAAASMDASLTPWPTCTA